MRKITIQEKSDAISDVKSGKLSSQEAASRLGIPEVLVKSWVDEGNTTKCLGASKFDLARLKSSLDAEGWFCKEGKSASYLGVSYDLVGSKVVVLNRFSVFVKLLPLLDKPCADYWKENFDAIVNSKDLSKIIGFGKCFALCLLAEEISTEVYEKLLVPPEHGLFGNEKFEFIGSSNVFFGCAKSGNVFGYVPRFPHERYLLTKSLKSILAASRYH